MQVLKASASVKYGRSNEPFRVVGLEGTFVFSTDGSHQRVLKWTDVRHHVKASHISFIVTYSGNNEEVAVDSRHELTETTWPPTVDGTIIFPEGSDSYHRTYTISIEIIKPVDGLFVWERQVKQARNAAAIHCAGPSSSHLARSATSRG